MPEPTNAREGDATSLAAVPCALNELFSLIYEELRRIASFVGKSEFDRTTNSTSLVHEAWMKLKDSQPVAFSSLPHFKAVAAKAMRQVLVDEARRRNAHKRGGSGEAEFVSLRDAANQTVSYAEERLALGSAVAELERLNPRQAQIVRSRFFVGHSVAETAAMLGVSASVVERDWRAARTWLAQRIRGDHESQYSTAGRSRTARRRSGRH